MSAQVSRKITKEGLQAASVVSALLLRVARPFYWHPGVGRGGRLRGASMFVLQFEGRHVGVTADHVLAQYFDALNADGRMICQIGQAAFDPGRALIARSPRLDIATFDIDPQELSKMGAIALDCRKQWPPPEILKGQTLSMAGYFDERRTEVARGHYEMEAWGAHGIADDVTARGIITIYEPASTLAGIDGIPKPPLGMNLSGCSGGPAILVKEVNGLMRLFPAGLIYRGPSGAAEGEMGTFDTIHIRRLHFIHPDGSIDDPDKGWLPR